MDGREESVATISISATTTTKRLRRFPWGFPWASVDDIGIVMSLVSVNFFAIIPSL